MNCHPPPQFAFLNRTDKKSYYFLLFTYSLKSTYPEFRAQQVSCKQMWQIPRSPSTGKMRGAGREATQQCLLYFHLGAHCKNITDMAASNASPASLLRVFLVECPRCLIAGLLLRAANYSLGKTPELSSRFGFKVMYVAPEMRHGWPLQYS